MTIRKLWTSVNAYLAGLDDHSPIPTDALTPEGRAAARSIQTSVETIQTIYSDRFRLPNPYRR